MQYVLEEEEFGTDFNVVVRQKNTSDNLENLGLYEYRVDEGIVYFDCYCQSKKNKMLKKDYKVFEETLTDIADFIEGSNRFIKGEKFIIKFAQRDFPVEDWSAIEEIIEDCLSDPQFEVILVTTDNFISSQSADEAEILEEGTENNPQKVVTED